MAPASVRQFWSDDRLGATSFLDDSHGPRHFHRSPQRPCEPHVGLGGMYFAPPLTSFEHKNAVMAVSPLLRELILRTVERAGLDSRVAPDTWMIRLLEEEVKAAEDSPLALPMPTDDRTLALAHHVLARPLNVNDESVDELAKQHGVARRTLERRFRDETGMSLGMWRQKGRLFNSIRLLAEGKSVTAAALDTGYSSVSAFIAAFKSTFGYTPGRL